MYLIAIQFGSSIFYSCLIEFKAKQIQTNCRLLPYAASLTLFLSPTLLLSLSMCVCVAHFVATCGIFSSSFCCFFFFFGNLVGERGDEVAGITPPRARHIFKLFFSSVFFLFRCFVVLLLFQLLFARIFSRFIY